jgi:hypothetical protein
MPLDPAELAHAAARLQAEAEAVRAQVRPLPSFTGAHVWTGRRAWQLEADLDELVPRALRAAVQLDTAAEVLQRRAALVEQGWLSPAPGLPPA